jgi:molybdopterin molybdotransferase
MISLQTAQRHVAEHSRVLGSKQIGIDDALGYVLAQDIRSPMDLPRFDNSAMDGFAVRSRDTTDASARQPRRLRIIDTLFAGDRAKTSLAAGMACRIMTGAPVPPGADAVVPVEDVWVEGSTLSLRKPIKRWRNVRHQGEEIKKGTLVLRSGEVIHPGSIACLAACGHERVRVIRKPAVSVIATGDEAVPPGSRLTRGQIYDSNSHMTVAMLRHMGIDVVRARRIKDHPTALANSVKAALRASDMLIVIGGVSMGDHDYVRTVLNRQGVRKIFWRVAQKPGKPLFFGKKNGNKGKLVFGLPGNPASAFTCFYLYVYPALRRMAGFRNIHLTKRPLTLRNSITPDKKKWRLLKGKTDSGSGGMVSEMPKQGSHMLTSLAEADSLIIVPPGEQGESQATLETYRLPYSEDTPR